MPARHLISIRDLSTQDVTEIFDLAADIKNDPEKYKTALVGKTVGLLLAGPSTRTRISMMAGTHQLGGLALQLDASDLGIGTGESLADNVRTLSQYVDGIVAGTHKHADLVELSRTAAVPVVNGLTELLHPCQALADFFTLRERLGALNGKKIAYVGQGNHMCHSLIYGAVKTGMSISVATPSSHPPKSIIVKSASREAAAAGVVVELGDDPRDAVRGACAVYTTGWTKDGTGDKPAWSESALGFQVNEALMAAAEPGAFFMHCLPTYREQEVTAEVMDGPRSIVFEQAHHRLHVQKAVLCALLGAR